MDLNKLYRSVPELQEPDCDPQPVGDAHGMDAAEPSVTRATLAPNSVVVKDRSPTLLSMGLFKA